MNNGSPHLARAMWKLAPPTALAVCIVHICSCFFLFGASERYEEVTTKRAADQVYFEDSLHVFFVDYTNPYSDREVLWISSYVEGSVKLHLHSMGDDSLKAIYHFKRQESPLYPVVYRTDRSRMVKCVILVDGRPKCARILPWIYPLPHPQWGTEYTVESIE